MALSKRDNNIPIRNIIDNVTTDLIKITDDKLKVILLTNVEKLRELKDIVNPVALTFSLLTTILTADFKDVIFPAIAWCTLFWIAFIVAIVWLIISLYRFFFKKVSIDDIIREIKNEPKK